jgi:hypothetical protein
MNLESLGQAGRLKPRDQKTNARVRRNKPRSQPQNGTANQCCSGSCEVTWKPPAQTAVPRSSS